MCVCALCMFANLCRCEFFDRPLFIGGGGGVSSCTFALIVVVLLGGWGFVFFVLSVSDGAICTNRSLHGDQVHNRVNLAYNLALTWIFS